MYVRLIGEYAFVQGEEELFFFYDQNNPITMWFLWYHTV